MVLYLPRPNSVLMKDCCRQLPTMCSGLVHIKPPAIIVVTMDNEWEVPFSSEMSSTKQRRNNGMTRMMMHTFGTFAGEALGSRWRGQELEWRIAR